MRIHSTLNLNQRGAVLLAMMAVLLILVTSAFLASLSLNKQRTQQGFTNAKVLSDAKQALMAYALVQTPAGKLPCPDFDGDGVGDYSGANCRTQRGYLPYRDLSLKEYRDAFNNLIWYAVDANYAKTGGPKINPSLGGQLSIDSQNDIVAVLLAPGTVLVNQQRQNTDNANRVTQYLEADNADGNSARYSKIKDETRNDDILAISALEFWPVMEKRVSYEVSQAIRAYYSASGCNELPWAATASSPGDSVLGEEWGHVPLGIAIPYAGASGCPSALTVPGWIQSHWPDMLYYGFCGPSGAGCITITGDKSGNYEAVLISAGPVLSGQARTSTNISDYLELENADLDMQFEYRDMRNFDGDFNDVVYPFAP